MQTGTLRDKDVGKIASDYEQLIWVFIYFRSTYISVTPK